MSVDKQKIASSFSQAAGRYDQAAQLQSCIATEMLNRLQSIHFQPNTILDLGCGTGRFTRALAKQYRKSHVLGLDIAPGMIAVAQQRNGWWRKPDYILGDAEALPLADQSVDLVFSSFALQWCEQIDTAFQEVLRVLKPNGLFMFSIPGPDSLYELALSWQAVDQYQHVNRFVDMHILGDALLRLGFKLPVMDVDRHCLHYGSVIELMRDLKAVGAQQVIGARNRGLTGRQRLAQLSDAYQQFARSDGQLPLTYEVIYGHAWRADMCSEPPFKQPVQVVEPQQRR